MKFLEDLLAKWRKVTESYSMYDDCADDLEASLPAIAQASADREKELIAHHTGEIKLLTLTLSNLIELQGAMLAAALGEALNRIMDLRVTFEPQRFSFLDAVEAAVSDVRDLITPTQQSALDKLLAETRQKLYFEIAEMLGWKPSASSAIPDVKILIDKRLAEARLHEHERTCPYCSTSPDYRHLCGEHYNTLRTNAGKEQSHD